MMGRNELLPQLHVTTVVFSTSIAYYETDSNPSPEEHLHCLARCDHGFI